MQAVMVAERWKMSSNTATRLSPRQRLSRGLGHTAAGPVEVALGTLGLSAQSVRATASGVRKQYRKSRLRKELAAAQDVVTKELSAASDVVASLPATFQEVRQSKRRRGPRPVVLLAAGVAALAVGAVAFSRVRRSSQPGPSNRPPSVDVEPRP
jgi:hypothetical protein